MLPTVHAIGGMGIASEIAFNELEKNILRTTKLRNQLENEILRLFPNTSINGNRELRICNTTNICFHEVPGEVFFKRLSQNGIYVS